ncbi:MAG: hypothetical protein ABR915_00035 [Thermoguttaceae bacterium]
MICWLHRSAVFASLLLAAAAVAAAAEPPQPGQESKDLTAMAELPHWPYGFATRQVPLGQPGRDGVVKAPLLAWVPPGAKHIRALFIVPNNTDSMGVAMHPAVRAVAAKHEMAILYLRNGDEPDVQSILDFLAEKTGIAEFRHAPWIVLGKSSRGKFPIVMAWNHPKRTIASISYHAETPTWPPADSAKLAGETILHVNANGESEWGGTWFVHVRPSLLNYRAQKNWLPHQVVAQGIGHGDYPESTSGKDNPAQRMSRNRVWDYLAVFIDKALDLRVPKDKYPTDGPIELKQVDDSTGYVIDPFAVEDLFRQPHYPLLSSGSEYLVGKEVENPGIFAAIPPARDYRVPEGVPVAPLVAGRSPSAWVRTDVKFAMKNDPMTNLGGWEALRPKPGDNLSIDGHEATFKAIAGKPGADKGGISLNGLKKWGQDLTVVGYTVLEVPETRRVRLVAPFSVAGRLQVVLGGVPVEHRQIVELQKGLYPMLVVLRLSSVNWGAVSPLFEEATDKQVEQSKEYAVQRAKRRAEEKRLLAEGLRNPIPLVRRAADVAPQERKKMFWVADREQAEAWFKLHAIHGQSLEVK